MTGPHVSRRIGALLRPDARFVERVEGRRCTWEGTIFSADVLTVGLPDGTQGRREVAVHHGGAGACVVADGQMCLVRQYRVAVGRMTLEIPAGKLDAGESPALCAARELREETGLVARELEPIAVSAGSIGFTNETTHIFLAHGVTRGESSPDEGELLGVVWLPVREVVDAVRAGAIQDAKTIVSALTVLERGLA